MSIELKCSGCGRTLRVPDSAEGKHARCPECQTVLAVPLQGAADLRAGENLWHVKTEDGRQFGPIPKADLDQWVAEGRVTPGTQLREQGSEQWMPAHEMYPALAEPAPVSPANPFADTPASEALNPYAPPAAAAAARYVQPHRGGAILTLGILAICCNICFIPGICAWSMGNSDLGAMRMGRMDPSGRGMTQAGMVLGIVGTILSAVMGLLQLVMGAAAGW